MPCCLPLPILPLLLLFPLLALPASSISIRMRRCDQRASRRRTKKVISSQRAEAEKSVIDCLAQSGGRERWEKGDEVSSESEKTRRVFTSSENMYALSAGEKGGNERKCEMGGTPSHVGGRASGRERGANERRDDRKMISPQISHHLKRTNPRGDRNRERKGGESGLEVKQTK